MQYNYPLIWSNPSARKKLLVRGNKFRTMYRPVKSEAFYQFFWREQRRTPFGVSLNTSIKQIANANRGDTKFSKRRWEKEEPETIQGKLGSRQLQRLMTTAWMKMLYSANSTGNRHISCKVSLWPQKTGREHNSRPTDPHSIWDDTESNAYDSLLTLLSVCILNRGYRLHHNFGLLNTNSDPMSKHTKQKKKVKKRGGYAKLYSAVYSSIV